MTISGNLQTLTGEPLVSAKLRLTATNTSANVLKSTSQEFTTDSAGSYSIAVPPGSYHIEMWDEFIRGYRSIGVFDTSTSSATDLSTLLMVEQTQLPREPILVEMEGMVQQVQQAATDIASVNKISQLTQAQYDAITTKDADTLYVVVG